MSFYNRNDNRSDHFANRLTYKQSSSTAKTALLVLVAIVIFLAANSVFLQQLSRKSHQDPYDLVSKVNYSVNFHHDPSLSLGSVPLNSTDPNIPDHPGPYVPMAHPSTSEPNSHQKPLSRTTKTPTSATPSRATTPARTPANTTLSRTTTTHTSPTTARPNRPAVSTAAFSSGLPAYNAFNTCKFRNENFTSAGLPSLPYKDTVIHQQEDSPETWDDECNYTSDTTNNPHWFLAVTKLSLNGNPDAFTWIVPGSYPNDTLTVNTRKGTIKGHMVWFQEQIYHKVSYHSDGWPERGTMCDIAVIPGISFDLWDFTGITPAATLCENLAYFLSTQL